MLAKTREQLVIRWSKSWSDRIPSPPLLHEAWSGGLLGTMKFEDYIAISPGVRSGKACIKGTRITVADVLEYLAGGMIDAQILADFPSLRPEHIRACLAFAAARERRLASGSAA